MKVPAMAALLLVPVLMPAADPPQPGSRLVDLNVVVLDKHGQPITDLTADDFQITDSGKPQKISFFRRNGQAAGQNQVPAPAPNQFSNRAFDRPQNATVILFDLMNLGFAARGIAANQITRQLMNLESAGSLYLYLLTVDGKLFPVHGVPPGGEQPERRPGAPPWTREIKPLMDSSLRTVTAFRPPDIDVFVRTQLTFSALEALGQQLSVVPGRKILVWVTDGVPVALGERRSDTGFAIDFTPLIRQFSEALDRYNIALYPVRQNMLGGSDDIGATSGGDGATGGDGTGIQSLATLNLFADLTGGRRSTDKDIGLVIQQASTDLRFYYQLGYYAPPSNWNDKFHKLRVTSKRGGAHIQAKTGYYAWKAGSRSQQAFAAAAAAPFDAEEIGLRATVSSDAQNRNAELATVKIDAQDIALAHEGDSYSGHLGIVVVNYMPNGLIASSPMTPLDIQYTAAERDQAIRNGIGVTEKLAAQGESRFRVIVFDRGSNAVGSITIPVGPSQLPQR